MGAYGDDLRWWSVLPPIWHDKVARLPRGASYTKERDAGRVMIALRWPKLWRGRVFIRNAFTPNGDLNGWAKEFQKKHGAEPVAVENMREFDHLWSRLKVAEGGKTGAYVPATRARKFRHTYLHQLQARGWEVVEGPFMVEDPMHNCALELSEKEWAELWATHRIKPWAMTYLGAQTGSKFIDTEETPQAAEIRLHYRTLGVCENWTPARVRALAERWEITTREMQHYVCCESQIFQRFLDGKLSNLPGPVCLLLFLMERHADQAAGVQFTDTLFPILGAQSSTAATAA